MPGPLLETKLHMPGPRRDLVDRTRLIDQLRRGAASLTLVSAPAGFGKTTLVADWLTHGSVDGTTTAWVSLDAADDDPRTFLAYLLAAIRTVEPGVAATASDLLDSPEASSIAILTALLNELQDSAECLVLVLDDYHVIQHPEIHEAMTFLVEHLPAQLRVVIASRSDPVLPLARMRARGELTELRAADLRFTGNEAAAYLTESMGLELDPSQVASLEQRTEGWIAALQLAALSLRDRPDPGAFIETFAGDDRYVIDYLAGEVLDRQREDVRRFLLETSILNRLDSSLCASVTGVADARAMLDALDHGNLFVVPLDDRRHAYRYHHLFADVLRTRLLDERPDEVAGLHRRASEWFELHGDPSEAVRHALAGHDVERAADLIEVSIPLLRRARQDTTLERWLDALPPATVAARPVLSVGLIGALMATGQFAMVEARLADTERRLADAAAGDDGDDDGGGGPTELVVVDHVEFARLPSQIAMYRAALALLRGDSEATTEFAGRSFDLAGPDDHLGRGSSAALLGLAAWRRGELNDATGWYVAALDGLEAAGHVSDLLGCSIAFADIRIAQGRLRGAGELFERGRQLAERNGLTLRGAADMHVGLADLLRERNELDAAFEQLDECDALGPQAGLPQNAYRRALVEARIRSAQGDCDRAFELLDRAQDLYDGDYSPDVRPIAAVRARLWVSQGEVERALRWAQDRDLSVDVAPTYLREYEHLTLAGALVAAARERMPGLDRALADATTLLDRLVSAAREGQRTGGLVEALAVRALAHRAGEENAAARAVLAEALTLGAPEGYVRVFLDHGAPMAGLLGELTGDDELGAAARGVLAAAGAEVTPLLGVTPASHGLVDPLSARELDVLRLLRTDLSGPEIARELIVSLNTVRTHTKSIYAKLGATSRGAAVRRADELGL